jgi:urocanate hydratase
LGEFDQENIQIDLGSDQTSLHNPWLVGTTTGLVLKKLMYDGRDLIIQTKVQETLRRHTNAINKPAKGTYFFDYGNAFFIRSFSSWCGNYGRK